MSIFSNGARKKKPAPPRNRNPNRNLFLLSSPKRRNMFSSNLALFIGGLGLQELLVIAGLAVLLFGGKKFAEMGKGLGEGIRGFKFAMREGEAENEELKKP